MAEVLNIWSGWPRIVEIAGNAFLFYALIIVMVRMVGNRTTSELNNFDWIINVMIGRLAASGDEAHGRRRIAALREKLTEVN